MTAHAATRDSRATREAFTLPLLLLLSGLCAAIRVDGEGGIRFVGPSLLALVLGVLLAGLLLRSGLLAPERLVGPRRPPLANANGVVVLCALLFAAAQVFTALTPEGGLMHALFGAFYVALLWTTGAARPTPPRLVRSLAVVFGSALVLRFVVLNGLAAPEGSLARRVFAAALEGLTPGGLGLQYHGPATGYAAFGALALFFIALLLLPHDEDAWALAGASTWHTLPPAGARRIEAAGRQGALPPADAD